MKSDICNHASKVVSFECYRWYHLSAMISYALRLAEHQSPAPCCAGWDRLGKGGGECDKSDMLLKPYNKYRAVSYELDAYERKKRIKDITYGHI